MKANEQYFPVVLFIVLHRLVVTFVFVGENLKSVEVWEPIRFSEFLQTNFGNLRCNLHWHYTFCITLALHFLRYTGITLFVLVLHFELHCF